MYHPSKPPMIPLRQLTHYHEMGKVLNRDDQGRIMPTPVAIGGYIGPKADINIAASTVRDQLGSGVGMSLWGNLMPLTR